MSLDLIGLSGLSLRLEPAETEPVLMEAASEDWSEDEEDWEGPSMERTTGSNTRPWKRPKTTVRLKTLKNVW